MTDEQPRGSTPREVLGSLSVREICAFDLLAEAHVLAGAAGLSRRVQRLNVMTVPDITRWTKQHELLLTTGYPLPDSAEPLIQLLTDLNARGVAAVGVKYGSYGPGLMPEALRAADKLELPIIDIPETVAFDDLLSEVLSDIANRQATALARAQEIHESLLQIFLDGGTLSDIARGLSTALGDAGVVCVDPAGRVLAQLMEEAHWDQLRRHSLLEADDTIAAGRVSAALPQADVGRPPMVCAPILAGTLRHGHLMAVGGVAPLPGEAEPMVQQSAMVAALEITQRLAVSSVERHFESNAIHDLLMGGAKDVSDVLSRADSFEWDLHRRLQVFVARRDQPPTDAKPNELRHKHNIDAWVNAVRSIDRAAVAGGLGRELVAVCGAADGGQSLAYAIAKGLADRTRHSISIGTSGVVSTPSELPTGYQHARTALDIAQQTSGPRAIMSYNALGLYRLLNAVDSAELHTFLNETLGEVLARPREERNDMLRTLEVLLDQRLNVAESARILHFHYNTMRYRIRKLQRLVGPFPTDSQLSLRLSVALQILRMREMSGRVAG